MQSVRNVSFIIGYARGISKLPSKLAWWEPADACMRHSCTERSKCPLFILCLNVMCLSVTCLNVTYQQTHVHDAWDIEALSVQNAHCLFLFTLVEDTCTKNILPNVLNRSNVRSVEAPTVHCHGTKCLSSAMIPQIGHNGFTCTPTTISSGHILLNGQVTLMGDTYRLLVCHFAFQHSTFCTWPNKEFFYWIWK